MDKEPKPSPAARVARMGLLFALALALSFLEGMVHLPLPAPGLKLGLSNIVVMYSLFLCGPAQAYLLGCLKAVFILSVRGMSGALLSFCGGMLSVTVMLAVKKLLRDTRYTVSSVAGAVSHNAGQLACATLLMKDAALWYYLPILCAAGVAVGVLTAVLLRSVIPALEKIHRL